MKKPAGMSDGDWDEAADQFYEPAPIPLSAAMLDAIRTWAADDRLWGSRSSTEFNLCTFARVILKAQAISERTRTDTSDGVSGTQAETRDEQLDELIGRISRDCYGGTERGVLCDSCIMELARQAYTLGSAPSGPSTAPSQSELELFKGRLATLEECRNNPHAAMVREGLRADAAERTVKSLATMLGWENVPPQNTLEAEIRALKARALTGPSAAPSEPREAASPAPSPVSAWQPTLEKYRQALQSIANSSCCGSCQEAALVAKTALGERCEGRYPVPQTAPPREEPFEVTYRCALPLGHLGPHRSEPIDSSSENRLEPIVPPVPLSGEREP